MFKIKINPAITIHPQPLMKSNAEKHMLEEASHEMVSNHWIECYVETQAQFC
jgi:hypothetical protein